MKKSNLHGVEILESSGNIYAESNYDSKKVNKALF